MFIGIHILFALLFCIDKINSNVYSDYQELRKIKDFIPKMRINFNGTLSSNFSDIQIRIKLHF